VTPINVLFVEDEPDIRFVVESALARDAAITVQSFSGGVDALEWIERTGTVFNFALLDFRLPFMTGIEFHERLQMLPGYRQIRTALITASLSKTEKAFYERAGIRSWISKPFDPLTLAQRVREIFEA
jgi:two-component system, OmpR family, response regulator